uniref:Uncharacterized protein n=1 Tax=Rhizophora mucronata TaxID=61149 RepID=A0A2P2R1D1_RHIMU
MNNIHMKLLKLDLTGCAKVNLKGHQMYRKTS